MVTDRERNSTATYHLPVRGLLEHRIDPVVQGGCQAPPLCPTSSACLFQLVCNEQSQNDMAWDSSPYPPCQGRPIQLLQYTTLRDMTQGQRVTWEAARRTERWTRRTAVVVASEASLGTCRRCVRQVNMKGDPSRYVCDGCRPVFVVQSWRKKCAYMLTLVVVVIAATSQMSVLESAS